MKISYPRLGALSLAVLGALLAATVPAQAADVASAAAPQFRTDPIVDLPPPGGPFGIYGYDVYDQQAVAQRFTVPADTAYRLARIGMYLMNNSDIEHRWVNVSLQSDALDEGGSDSMPSGHVLESWGSRVQTLGWSPVEQFFVTTRAPRLKAGRNYWVVAASRAVGGANPVWVVTRKGLEVTSLNTGGGWAPGGQSGALTLRVDALPLTKD